MGPCQTSMVHWAVSINCLDFQSTCPPKQTHCPVESCLVLHSRIFFNLIECTTPNSYSDIDLCMNSLSSDYGFRSWCWSWYWCWYWYLWWCWCWSLCWCCCWSWSLCWCWSCSCSWNWSCSCSCSCSWCHCQFSYRRCFSMEMLASTWQHEVEVLIVAFLSEASADNQLYSARYIDLCAKVSLCQYWYWRHFSMITIWISNSSPRLLFHVGFPMKTIIHRSQIPVCGALDGEAGLLSLNVLGPWYTLYSTYSRSRVDQGEQSANFAVSLPRLPLPVSQVCCWKSPTKLTAQVEQLLHSLGILIRQHLTISAIQQLPTAYRSFPIPNSMFICHWLTTCWHVSEIRWTHSNYTICGEWRWPDT